MKLAVVGGRNFDDYEYLERELDKLDDIEMIVSGGAKGADTLAERYAHEHGIKIKIFPPEWEIWGKQACNKRNHQIVDECDQLIAFWDGESRGTAHSVALAVMAGKKVRIRKFGN